MKLAEALKERADMDRKIGSLQSRIGDNSVTQEGDAPLEDPLELIAELREAHEHRRLLSQAIRVENYEQTVDWNGGSMPIDSALVLRDYYLSLEGSLRSITSGRGGGYLSRSLLREFRQTKSEIKYEVLIDVRGINKEADELAKRARQLDAVIQAKNWEVDLHDLSEY